MKKVRPETNKEPRRILRKKKKLCYFNSTLKKNSGQQKRSYQRRHRSCEPNTKLKKNPSLLKFRKKRRPCSASSLKSVVYIGKYRKIPKLVILDDSSDDEKPELFQRKLRKRQSSSFSLQETREKNSDDTNKNFIHTEGDLLNMLKTMHINNSVVKTIFDCSNTHECQI